MFHERRERTRIGASMLGAVATILLVMAGSASAQFREGHEPGDLRDYDWTIWLEGTWEGYREAGGQRSPLRQSFEFAVDGRYVLTRSTVGDGDRAYSGMGVFSYYPATGHSYGEWFGDQHDTNYGWGVRDGDRLVWTIYRQNMIITRVRTRVADDEYVVDNSVVLPDGSTSGSREVMRRVAMPATSHAEPERAPR